MKEQENRIIKKARIVSDMLKYIADRAERLPSEKPDPRVRFWRLGRVQRKIERDFDRRDFYEMFKK